MFSIGFGPELVGFNDRHGTRWKLSAVPLGGYVKFFGDENAASVPDQAAARRHDARPSARTASSTSRWRRAPPSWRPARSPISSWRSSIFAGDFHDRTASQTRPPRVDAVQAGSAAAAAGFQPGDLVLVDRRPADRQLRRHAAHRRISAGEPLDVVVERGGAHGDACRRRRRSRRSRTISATSTASACSASAGRWRRATSSSRPVGPLDGDRLGRAGDLVRRRPHAVLYRRRLRRPRSRRSARRPDPDRPGVRPGRRRVGLRRRLIHLAGGAVGLDRPAEPVSDPAARWRSPFVLWDRGGARAAAVGAGAGDRLPHRASRSS